MTQQNESQMGSSVLKHGKPVEFLDDLRKHTSPAVREAATK